MHARGRRGGTYMDNVSGDTGYTRLMYEAATSAYLTLPQAVEQLRRDAHARTVRDTLAKAAGIPAEDKGALQAFLTDALMETTPGAKRDSVSRKVRVWLNDEEMRTITKESAIQLCFALKLPLQEADALLMRLCEEGFHWRDQREIVYIYALMRGQDYTYATALYAAMEQRGVLDKRREGAPTSYTAAARERLQSIGSEAELEEYLQGSAQELGALHNTAYSLFMDFLELLGLPVLDDQLPDVRELSVRNIMDTYLHERFIPRIRRAAKGDAEKAALTALQKDIRQSWPDETALSKMVHRETDVTRKVLILLFLATDGGTSEYGDDLDFELTPEESFEDMYGRMNSMLADCGFAPLDSRVPFDWMVLYCMCADESIFIDGRVQRFLSELFSTGDGKAELADGQSARK